MCLVTRPVLTSIEISCGSCGAREVRETDPHFVKLDVDRVWMCGSREVRESDRPPRVPVAPPCIDTGHELPLEHAAATAQEPAGAGTGQ